MLSPLKGDAIIRYLPLKGDALIRYLPSREMQSYVISLEGRLLTYAK